MFGVMSKQACLASAPSADDEQEEADRARCAAALASRFGPVRRHGGKRQRRTILAGVFLVLLPAGRPQPVLGHPDRDERAHVRCSGGGPADLTAEGHVLTESASCPLEVLQQVRSVNVQESVGNLLVLSTGSSTCQMAGRQISPRLPQQGENTSEAGDDVPARPESFRSQSSIIQKLENG